MFWRWMGALMVSGRPSARTQRGDLELLGVAAAVVGDAVGVGGLGVLDRDLHVVEPALGQPLQALAREQHGRGDQVGVEADLGRLRDDRPRGRGARSARRPRDAAAGRRGRRPGPARRARSRSAARRRRAPAPAGWSSRGTAAGSDGSARPAARRARGRTPGRPAYAAVGLHAHAVTTPLSARSCSMALMSARMALPGRVVGLRQLAGDGVDACARRRTARSTATAMASG